MTEHLELILSSCRLSGNWQVGKHISLQTYIASSKAQGKGTVNTPSQREKRRSQTSITPFSATPTSAHSCLSHNLSYKVFKRFLKTPGSGTLPCCHCSQVPQAPTVTPISSSISPSWTGWGCSLVSLFLVSSMWITTPFTAPKGSHVTPVGYSLPCLHTSFYWSNWKPFPDITFFYNGCLRIKTCETWCSRLTMPKGGWVIMEPGY